MVTDWKKPAVDRICLVCIKAVSVDLNINKHTQRRTQREPDHFMKERTNWLTFKWMEALEEQMNSFPAFLLQFRPPPGYKTETMLK